MAVEYLGIGEDDGTVMGRSATDLIAFHNATPSDQRAHTAAVSTSLPVSTTAGVFGFATSAQVVALITLVNELRALAVEKGLMAAS